MEMFAVLPSTNVSTRLKAMSPNACPPRTKLPCASSTSAAPRIPKMAPDAPTVTAFGLEEQRTRRAGEPGNDVERQEASPPDRLLDRDADDPEHEHVHPEVDEAAVQERRSDQTPPLAVGEPAGERRADVEGAFLEERARDPVESRALREVEEEDEDVDRDQRLRDERAAALVGGPADARGHARGALSHSRVVGAADPDWREDHAVRADAAAALGARDAGLAVRMPVAVHLPLAPSG